jgi:pilus assembly protein CpaD
MILKNLIAGPRATGAACALSLAVLLGGCGISTNRTLESYRQPVVEKTNFTLDLTSGPGGLGYSEQRRLADWFETLDLRYGDRIAIEDPLDSGQTRASVESIAGRHGMMLSDTAPVTAGYVNAGNVRVVVTRSKATVPNCPNWRSKSDFNPNNATSSNYGCATNSNLAAMVANPEHLIKGAEGTGETVIMSSNKAIETYRNLPPTGEKGLKANTTGN